MATRYASVRGIRFMRESIGSGTGTGFAVVTFEMPDAYTASADNGQLGGGGFDRGAATTDSLQTIISKQRRDGKTVTLQNATVGLATTLQPGKQGATEFWAGTFAISSGNITFNLCNSAGTEIDAASGVTARCIALGVSYTLS